MFCTPVRADLKNRIPSWLLQCRVLQRRRECDARRSRIKAQHQRNSVMTQGSWDRARGKGRRGWKRRQKLGMNMITLLYFCGESVERNRQIGLQEKINPKWTNKHTNSRYWYNAKQHIRWNQRVVNPPIARKKNSTHSLVNALSRRARSICWVGMRPEINTTAEMTSCLCSYLKF